MLIRFKYLFLRLNIDSIPKYARIYIASILQKHYFRTLVKCLSWKYPNYKGLKKTVAGFLQETPHLVPKKGSKGYWAKFWREVTVEYSSPREWVVGTYTPQPTSTRNFQGRHLTDMFFAQDQKLNPLQQVRSNKDASQVRD